ncbi:MAG TPA: hypothetical protein PK559_12950 [Ignavibacteriaceae bacterium]|nr:hypothetical protein [Ignavibacteriaceae bacterium]
MDISPEFQIKASLKSGSVYYFEDNSLTSIEPHYFVVLNHDPSNDFLLLLVCSSSQIDKVRIRNKNNPSTTLVEITPKDYPDFTKDSIIDCNKVFPRSVNDLVNKLKQGKLKLKSELSANIVNRLQQGVLDSSMVEESLKRILRQ